MEEWKEYKLEDICTELSDGLHKAPKFVNGGDYIFVNAKNISNGFIVDNDPTKKSTYEEYLKYSSPLKETTVLYSIDGTIGNIALYRGEKCILGKGACYLNPNPALLNRMCLYYELQTPRFKSYIDKMSTGSTIKHISLKTMRNYVMKVPSLNTQQQIVSILKSLDDKIEVNRRINENLEQQAQALFKSWFVDFEPFKNGEFVESELGMIPKGWRVCSADEMTSKFGTGLNPRKNFKLGEGNNYYVTIKNMGNNRVYLDERCDKVTDEAIEKINKRSKLQAGDLLFSGIGTIGRVALITETPTNWNTSESVFNMHPADNISSEFLYVLLLSDVFQQYVKLHAQGGVQQGIRMASLKEYKMAIPDDNILQEFDKKVIPLVSLVKKTDDETDRLATLRDTLLPKLMSGELKVNEIEI